MLHVNAPTYRELTCVILFLYNVVLENYSVQNSLWGEGGLLPAQGLLIQCSFFITHPITNEYLYVSEKVSGHLFQKTRWFSACDENISRRIKNLRISKEEIK